MAIKSAGVNNSLGQPASNGLAGSFLEQFQLQRSKTAINNRLMILSFFISMVKFFMSIIYLLVNYIGLEVQPLY
jgi:hypothetical protein